MSFLYSPSSPRPTQCLEFQFRSRTIKAIGTPLADRHSNILRLQILPAATDKIMQSRLSAGPDENGCTLPTAFSEWSLPETVILKFEDDEGSRCAERFDSEVYAYHMQRPIQGDAIPIFYGTVICNNRRAMIIQDVGGSNILDPQGAILSKEELLPLLYHTMKALNQYGRVSEYVRPCRFLLVTESGKDRIVRVDLEGWELHSPETIAESDPVMDTWEFMDIYDQQLQTLESICKLMPSRSGAPQLDPATKGRYGRYPFRNLLQDPKIGYAVLMDPSLASLENGDLVPEVPLEVCNPWLVSGGGI